MLTDREMERLLGLFQQRMQGVTDAYLTAMGEHIAKIGTLYPSDVNRLIEMRRVNADMRDVQEKLAQACGQSVRDIAQIFEAIAFSDTRFARKYMQDGAFDPELLRGIIEAQLEITGGAFRNISQTTIESEAYRDAVDAGIAAVQSGVGDYHTELRHTISSAAGDGVQIRFPSGYKCRLDTAVRQNVLDGVRACHQKVLDKLGEAFGADGVEISAHMLCADDHLPYQGRQYEKDVFAGIQHSLDRPFGMWNCRHTMYPIILGISEAAYTDEQLEEMKAYSTEEIEIDGHTKTRYEWSQEMRKTETAIRWQKDVETAMLAAGDKTGAREARNKQDKLKEYYMQITGESGIKADWTRTNGSLTAGVDSGKMATDSREDLYEITKDSASFVPKVTEFETDELNEFVWNKCKEILDDLALDEVGTEETISIRISDLSTEKNKSKPGGGAVKVAALESEYIAIHNHPSCETLSYNDINIFANDEKMIAAVVIGNTGKNMYTLLKTEKYDFYGFLKYYLKQKYGIEKFESEEDFLKGSELHGVRYVKRIG